MAASASDAHEWPIYNARFRLVVPLLDADGDPVSPSSPDTEISQDQGTFADATNEATEIATSSGVVYVDLVAGEMDTKCTAVRVQSTGAKTTVATLFPRRLPVLRAGTAQAGAASTITLDSSASAVTDYYVGCYVNITNNSPANAQGQARKITAYNGGTKVATVEGTYGTNPSSASTFEVLATEDWIYRLGDVTAYGGVAGTFASGRPEVNTTHAAGTAWASGAITAAVIATGAIDADAIADNAIDAGAIAADAITSAKIADGAITNAKVADDLTVGSVTGAVGSVTAGVTLANGVTHGGATAVLQLQQVAVSNSSGNAVQVVTGGTNNVAVQITSGDATAVSIAPSAGNNFGLTVLGRGTQDAVWVRGGLTSGRGILVQGQGGSADIDADLTGNVTGSVGSVTGNVGGNVVGSAGSLAAQAQADVRAAAGLASANLDTQLAAIDDFIDTEVAAILAAVTTEVADIKAVTDLLVSAQAELAAVPAANASPLAKLGWLFLLARNKLTQTSATQAVRNDADNANVATAAVSDDGTTLTRAEWS